MNKENKLRLFSLLSLVFIMSSPFIMTFFPQTIPFFLYPILASFILIVPAFFALLYAPNIGNLIYKSYNFYHKKMNHKYEIFEGKPKRVISRLYVSLLASIYPLGMVFKILDGSDIVNEIDMKIVTSVFAVQVIIINLSYALYVLSRSKLMVKFDDGNQFNIGDRIRDKLNWFALGSIFIIITMIHQSLVTNQLLFLGTLAASAAICFGSNVFGFYVLERTKRIPISVRKLKKLLRTSVSSDYKTV